MEVKKFILALAYAISGILVVVFAIESFNSTIDLLRTFHILPEKKAEVVVREERTPEQIAVYKVGCVTYDYRTLARDPALHEGESIKLSGWVGQVIENGENITILANVTFMGDGEYEDTVYITYTRWSHMESHVLEDDIVDMYGTFQGLKTYQSVSGESVTVPYLIAEYIDIRLD